VPHRPATAHPGRPLHPALVGVTPTSIERFANRARRDQLEITDIRDN
jgi:hypothetical protein